MYINQLEEYNENYLKNIKSMVLSCDICGGVQNKLFDIKLLKYFDFLFLSQDDLDLKIKIEDLQEYIKGYIILHENKYYRIIGKKGTDIDIKIELDKEKILSNINVLGAGDFFADSFIFNIYKNINNINQIKDAIYFSQNSVTNTY